MSSEQDKLYLDTYFIDMTYKLPFLSKVFYVREKEIPNEVIFAKFSSSKEGQNYPEAILSTTIPFFQFMRKVYVYSDKKREHKYFSIIQSRFAFPHRYIIRDEQDAVIGFIETRSLLFKRAWSIIDKQGMEIGSLRENVGDNIAEEFRFTIQKVFSFSFFIQDRMIGNIGIETDYYSLSRKFTLDLTDDKEIKLDRRLALTLIFLVDDFVGTAKRGAPGV